MTLGQRIQEHRLRLELSQEALGERLGVSRQAVSKWEADAAVPDTDKLIALSKLFGLTLNELLQVEGPEGAAPAAEPASERAPEGTGSRKPGKRWLRRPLPGLAVLALCLGLTAATVSFGRTVGQLSDRIARLEQQVSLLESGGASLDPAELVAGWEIQAAGGLPSVQDGEWTEGASVQLLLSRHDPERPVEVFFQLSADGMEPVRQEASGAGLTYSAQLRLPRHWQVTLSVGFRRDGVEYLQPLARALTVSQNEVTYIPILV